MLKRNDLTKQFELIVQQEIKNHNDSLLATNIAINEMREYIERDAFKQNQINACVSSCVNEINQNSTELSKKVLDLSKKLDSFMQDMSEFMEKARAEIKLSVENAITASNKHEKNQNEITDLKFMISNLHDDVIGRANCGYRDMEDVQRKCFEYSDKLKNEILSRPSEAQEVKTELEGKLATAYVDFTGLLKEILIVKKRSFIVDKNLENIYTEIEKLKK